MLPLHGTATFCEGFEKSPRSTVIRVREGGRPGADAEHDFLLTRGSNTVGSSSGGGALFISDEPAPNGSSVGRAVGPPSRFGYLADGDIIALHPKTKRFRTLYRRSSHHNSFLVTERCNHY